jgi:uncharacterized protein YbaA (DUF1428 family)
MTLWVIEAHFADAPQVEVKDVRMQFEAKEKEAIVASRSVVVDIEELDELMSLWTRIESVEKEPSVPCSMFTFPAA